VKDGERREEEHDQQATISVDTTYITAPHALSRDQITHDDKSNILIPSIPGS
jgi:hypothetical protein